MPHAPEAPPVLVLEGFGLSFHTRTVLQSVSLALAPTGCHVLLGPSGTGKSALLRTLAGFNDAHPALEHWGQALYRNAPLGPDNRPPLMMQKAQLMVSSVLDNLQSGLPDRARMTRAAQIDHIAQAVSDMGEAWVTDAFHKPVVDLSLCQQRVVSILRALLANPALLMLDEPTTGMSEADAQYLMDLMVRQARHRSLLVAMHHLAQTRRMADQVLLLASGSIQEQAPVQAFFEAPRSLAAQQFVRTGSCAEFPLVREDDGVATAPAEPAPAAEAAPATEDRLQPVPDIGTPSTPPKSAACGPRGFVWLLPGQLAGTPWPGLLRETGDDLRDLQHVGVTRLVNLTETAFAAEALARHGLQGEWLPVIDMQAPTATQAARLCADIDAWLRQSQVVALHCRAGLGRTGTLLAAYWLWRGHGKRTAVEAIEKIRQLNHQMIQSQEQVQFLERFSSWLSQSVHSAPA